MNRSACCTMILSLELLLLLLKEHSMLIFMKERKLKTTAHACAVILHFITHTYTHVTCVRALYRGVKLLLALEEAATPRKQ
jgi:hypothetical protein